MEVSEFGKLLMKLREEQRYSMNELAKEAKVSVAHLSRIESGVRPAPSPEFIRKLSTVIGHYREMMKAAGHIISGYDLAMELAEKEIIGPQVARIIKGLDSEDMNILEDVADGLRKRKNLPTTRLAGSSTLTPSDKNGSKLHFKKGIVKKENAKKKKKGSDGIS